jgi:hypothetical protein
MRKWQRLSIAGLLICLLGLYPLLAPPAHRIDQDHFDLIHNGMTLGEVESIFGQPAGNYDWAVAEGANVWFLDFAGANFTLDVSGGRRLLPLGTLSVDFDGDGFLDLHVAKSQGGLRTVVWSDLTGSCRAAKTWTSRHGTCTIAFDQHGRVSGNAGWGESRVLPPWQTWWKKLVGE